jgi:hypothetical protein
MNGQRRPGQSSMPETTDLLGALALITIWLAVSLYLRQFSLWMIPFGAAFGVLLVVLALVLTHLAGPAAAWDGATLADRAGGRGAEADAAFEVWINLAYCIPCFLGLSLITLVGAGVQAARRALPQPTAPSDELGHQ